jgi:hypothetical protein
VFGGGQSVLGVEQDGGGVLGQHGGDEGLELFERGGGDSGGSGGSRADPWRRPR